MAKVSETSAELKGAIVRAFLKKRYAIAQRFNDGSQYVFDIARLGTKRRYRVEDTLFNRPSDRISVMAKLQIAGFLAIGFAVGVMFYRYLVAQGVQF